MTLTITDEQVERARKKWGSLHWITPGPADMRAILEAAAPAPPAEPEIRVTEEMREAGVLEVRKRFPSSPVDEEFCCVVYRAMRKLEPKEAKAAERTTICVTCGAELQAQAGAALGPLGEAAGFGHSRATDFPICRQTRAHRRKDDPRVYRETIQFLVCTSAR